MAKLKIWIARNLLGIKYGPYMIPVRDYWLFIDYYQQTWKIKYTMRPEHPFIIELWER